MSCTKQNKMMVNTKSKSYSFEDMEGTKNVQEPSVRPTNLDSAHSQVLRVSILALLLFDLTVFDWRN